MKINKPLITAFVRADITVNKGKKPFDDVL
jgi:hypothetical protein